MSTVEPKLITLIQRPPRKILTTQRRNSNGINDEEKIVESAALMFAR